MTVEVPLSQIMYSPKTREDTATVVFEAYDQGNP